MAIEKRSVSIREVAARAGVSIASVSRALKEGGSGVSAETRQRILSAVEALEYSPNHIGRALRAQTTNTYALIISNIQNNFYAAVAWELERLLRERGQAMMLYTSNESPAIQDRCLEDIKFRRVSGLFLLCAVDSTRLREIVKQEKVVFVNRRVVAVPGSFVGIDDYSAARDLGAAALRRRGGPVAIVHGPLSSDTSARRLQGFIRSCEDAGIVPAAESVREARLSMESGYDVASEILARGRFKALFCGNDQIAFGAYRRCAELEIVVPQDMAIYGFDDNPLNEWLARWLNTVRVPHLEFAKSSVEEMDRLRENLSPREVILPYEIVLRS